MYLSKSKYCNGVQCMKMLWLDKFYPEKKEEVSNQSVLDNGSEVGEVAKGLFGEYKDIDFNNDLTKMISDTLEVISNNDQVNITEASFVYKDNFCSVDILKKNNDEYEMYEVKGSSKVNDIYIEDLSYQYYILTNLGLRVKECYVVYVKSRHVR